MTESANTRDQRRAAIRAAHAARRPDIPRPDDEAWAEVMHDADAQWSAATQALDNSIELHAVYRGTTTPVMHNQVTIGIAPYQWKADHGPHRLETLLDNEAYDLAAVVPPWAVVIAARDSQTVADLLREQLIPTADKTWWWKSPRSGFLIWMRATDCAGVVFADQIAHIDGAVLIPPGTRLPLPGALVDLDGMRAPLLAINDDKVGVAATPPALVGRRPRYPSVAALVAGGGAAAPRPTLLHRDDGSALLYPAELNIVYGASGVGKTYLAVAAGAETLLAGGSFVFIDLDGNGLPPIVARLRQLGAPLEALCDQDRFRYTAPGDRDELIGVLADLIDRPPTIAVVDALTPLVELLGGNSLSEDDITGITKQHLQPVTQAGVCVVLIDHTIKSGDGADPAGAASKIRVVGGTAISARPGRRFEPGVGGALKLVRRKDRHGGVAAQGGVIGTFVMDPPDTSGVTAWRISCPVPDTPAVAPEQPGAVDRHWVAAQKLGEFTVRQLVVAVHELPGGVKLTDHRELKSRAERWIDKATAQDRVAVVPGVSPKRWKVL